MRERQALGNIGWGGAIWIVTAACIVKCDYMNRCERMMEAMDNDIGVGPLGGILYTAG